MAKEKKEGNEKEKKAIHDLNRVLEELRMKEFEGKEIILQSISNVIAIFESAIPDPTAFVP